MRAVAVAIKASMMHNKFAMQIASPTQSAFGGTQSSGDVKEISIPNDHFKLARMAAMNELKPVHMPTPEHREFRSLVKYRKTLDGRINRIKNTIRSFFVNHGITIDRGAKAWHFIRQSAAEIFSNST